MYWTRPDLAAVYMANLDGSGKEEFEDQMGELGGLRKLACSYKGMNYPGEAITCKGRVNKKYVAAGEHCVECSLWAENASGEKTVTGTAVIMLPARVETGGDEQ